MWSSRPLKPLPLWLPQPGTGHHLYPGSSLADRLGEMLAGRGGFGGKLARGWLGVAGRLGEGLGSVSDSSVDGAGAGRSCRGLVEGAQSTSIGRGILRVGFAFFVVTGPGSHSSLSSRLRLGLLTRERDFLRVRGLPRLGGLLVGALDGALVGDGAGELVGGAIVGVVGALGDVVGALVGESGELVGDVVCALVEDVVGAFV